MNCVISILSSYDCHEIPKHTNFLGLIAEITRHHFIRKPAAIIMDMNAGVPSHHILFWCSVTGGMLYDIYQAMTATNGKILSMISNTEMSNTNEERVFSYLRNFIGDLRQDELFLFLRFVTGKPAGMSKPMQVTFNSQGGATRCPIAHTCAFALELSTTYTSCVEFKEEFQSILSNKEHMWYMHAL